MNHHRARFACVFLLAAFAACSSTPRAPGNVATNNRLVLSTEEMQRAGSPDVYTTIQTLRPQWLLIRGTTRLRNPPATIKVYLDGSLLGGPELLKQITTKSISDARYIDGLEASQRWGLDHDMGAIVVTTRRN